MQFYLYRRLRAQIAARQDENLERGNWSGKLDFLISSIGYAVGLGNVWRFPYLCYKNGGGAFIVTYFFFMFAIGIPLFLMELALGQFTSEGPLTMWQFAPIFKGIGMGWLCVCFLVATYFNVIIGWSIWYLIHSFRKILPWSECGEWSSQLCNLPQMSASVCEYYAEAGKIIMNANGTCFNVTSGTIGGIYNISVAAAHGIISRVPAADYMKFVSLRISDGIDEIGMIRWEMLLCFLLGWVLTFFSLLNGVKTSGRVAYFTAIFPYILLIILFINGLLQKGYLEGYLYFITPRMEKLKDIRVWQDAAVQLFYSLGICWGGLATMGSYNRFHTNAVRDTFIITLSNSLTSVFTGLTIFSYLGSYAHARGMKVADVMDTGVGLTFVVYPQALTTLPFPPLWSTLFFLMIVLLGMDTQFALIETITSGIVDPIARLRPHKTFVILGVCVFCFLLGLVMATPGGVYILTLLDDYACGWNLMVILLLECLAVGLYGFKRFARDIETMVGRKVIGTDWRILRWYFIVCWAFVAPACAIACLILSWILYTPSFYNNYKFPLWANAIGWLLTFLVLFLVFATMVYLFIRTQGSWLGRLKTLTTPSLYWGPTLRQHRELITYVPGFAVDPDCDTAGLRRSMFVKSSGKFSLEASTDVEKKIEIEKINVEEKEEKISVKEKEEEINVTGKTKKEEEKKKKKEEENRKKEDEGKRKKEEEREKEEEKIKKEAEGKRKKEEKKKKKEEEDNKKKGEERKEKKEEGETLILKGEIVTEKEIIETQTQNDVIIYQNEKVVETKPIVKSDVHLLKGRPPATHIYETTVILPNNRIPDSPKRRTSDVSNRSISNRSRPWRVSESDRPSTYETTVILPNNRIPDTPKRRTSDISNRSRPWRVSESDHPSMNEPRWSNRLSGNNREPSRWQWSENSRTYVRVSSSNDSRIRPSGGNQEKGKNTAARINVSSRIRPTTRT